MSRKLSTAVLLALVAALALAMTSSAAKPKEGNFVWIGKNNSGSVGLAVDGGVIESVSVSSLGCNGGAPISLIKNIDVSRSGKFNFKGKAAFLSGEKVDLKLEGKFVAKKKAKGAATFNGCEPKPKRKMSLDFTAKWTRGG